MPSQESKINKPFFGPAFWKIMFVGTAVYYLGVCLIHWLGRRPLWLDEGMVFESVRDFQPGEFFTRRLACGQIFPKMSLFCIQAFSRPFALDLLSVRFLSLTAMFGAFAVWMSVARRELKNPSTLWIFLLSWTGSSLLVYYSAELKPYSMDVLVAGLFMLFLGRADGIREQRPWLYLAGLALLPVLGIFSYPAFLFYVFLLLHLLSAKIKGRFWVLCCAACGISALLVLYVVYLWDIRFAKANTGTQGFADHIVSLVSVSEFFKSWWEGTTDLFCRFFAERPRVFKRISLLLGLFGFGSMILGFVRQVRREGLNITSLRTVAVILYCELFVLGILQRYPFSVPRTSLFFCPLILLLISDGIAELEQWNRYAGKAVRIFYILFLIVIASGIGREAITGHLGFAPLIWG